MCSPSARLAAYTALNEDTWDYLNGSTLAWISSSAEEQLQRWDILVIRWIYQEHWGLQEYIRGEEIRTACFHRLDHYCDSLNRLHEINSSHSCFSWWWTYWAVQFFTRMTWKYECQFPLEPQPEIIFIIVLNCQKIVKNVCHSFPETKIISVSACFVPTTLHKSVYCCMKHQIHTYEKVGTEIFWVFLLKIWCYKNSCRLIHLMISSFHIVCILNLKAFLWQRMLILRFNLMSNQDVMNTAHE